MARKEDLPKAKITRDSLKKASRIFSFIGRHRWKFFLGMFFLAGTAATALIFPYLLGDLMGIVGKTDSAEVLIAEANRVGLFLLILFSAQAVFSFFRVLLFVSVTENMLRSLRQAVYDRLIRMPMSFFSQRQVAELNSRVSADISQIQETFTTSIAEFLRQTIIIVGGITFICLTSIKLAGVMLSIIPVLAVITVFFGRKIRKISRSVQDKVAESNVIVGESLQGITNVKSFTNEKYETERYKGITSDIVRLAMKGGMARGAFFSFIIFCLFGSIIFIVWYVVKLKVDGIISPDSLMQFLILTIMVAGSIGGLPEQYAQIQRAIGATERVFDLLDDEIEEIDLQKMPVSAVRFKGEVVFNDVSFSYPSRKDFQVLKNISFKTGAGQTVAFVGPSGSGKSTLASLILRFYHPTSGAIFIDGKNSLEYNLTELRSQMAIVPQDVLLFGGSIFENIAYGKPGAGSNEVSEAAKKANAYDFIMSFPEKFDTMVGERGIQLSGGQRQRIAIARAVLKNPSILILDEATSSLDSESERLVQEALEKLMVGRTSFVIAHRLSTVRNADKIVVIEKGEVRETGTHEQLMQVPDGLYKSLVRLQMERM